MPKKQALEYDARIPPFLARLKAGHVARDGRHEVAVPRVQGGKGGNERLRMDDEEEDAPVVVNLDGHRDENEVVDGDERQLSNVSDTDGAFTEEMERSGDSRRVQKGGGDEPNVTSGFGRKRKIGRVVGENRSDPDTGIDVVDQAEPVKSITQSTEELSVVIKERKAQARSQKKSEAETETEIGARGPTKSVGRKKKIKLSFDEGG